MPEGVGSLDMPLHSKSLVNGPLGARNFIQFMLHMTVVGWLKVVS